MGTKNNLGKFDCYAGALPDEPMFVLLARDPVAPEIIREWARRRSAYGNPNDDEKIVEAGMVAEAMKKWRYDNLGKWKKS